VAVLALLHAAGIVGQAVLLVVIAGMPGATAGAHLAATALLVAGVLLAWRRLPVSVDMPLAMLTVGGLGMTLGWWADLGFGSAATAHGAGSAFCTAPGGGHGHGLLSWMNAGMLASGLPAMRWLQRDAAAARCGARACLVAAPWMVLGMELGARAAGVAAGIVPGGLAAPQLVLLEHAGMNVGMLLGMAAAPWPGRLWRRRAARPALAR